MANEQLSSNSEGKEDLTKDDIERALADESKDEKGKDDDDEIITDEEKEEKEDDGDDDDDDKDKIKLEDGEEDEEKDLGDVDLVAPFRKAEIEKDFPGIFKKYGYLEKAYYRDRAFTEVFQTPEDAKEAQESIQEMETMEQALFEGNNSDLLGRVKEADEKAFQRIVDNYLGNLQKVDQNAHNHVVGGVVKNLIGMMAREAKKSDNDELRKVALAINRFVFDSDEYEPHKPLVDLKAENTVDDERQQFLQERFETVQDELQTKVDDILTTTIKNNIDPREVLTDYVKKNAIRDAMEDLKSSIDRDVNFRKGLDRLWEKAHAANFNRESTKAIKDYYLAKAKSVITPVVRKARGEALKGIGKKVREDGDSDTRKTEKERPYHKGTRGSTPSDKGGQKSKADNFKGSTLDFLNSD